MPMQKINGIQIYYEIHGKGEPLILIMGLRRNVEWWYRQVPDLSKYFKVLIFDNRGSGRTEKPVMDYSIRLFADDTAGLMEAHDIKKAHILGVSMGGYIAQELTINYPERVRSLILGCTSAGGKRAVLMSPERLKKFTANEGLSPEQILQKDMDIYFSDKFVQENPERIKEFIEISLRYYQPPDAFMRQFNACLRHDTVNRLNQITVPTLIASGDDDPLIPPENSRILKEIIPHSELILFPGRRHCFFLEGAERFNRMAINFFKSA
jgi:pimeloyl-ACP methyl ester carboxylesterase